MSEHAMPAEAVLSILAALEREDVEYCLSGGWAVDALLGEQTREHSDLDLWLPAAHLGRLFIAFARIGLDRIFPWPGDRPWNFVLHDGRGLRVDLHLYETLDGGTIHYGSAIEPFEFPAAALSGSGSILGVAVRCELAEWTLRWHTGYPPREVDRHDVARLVERFGFEVPEPFK